MKKTRPTAEELENMISANFAPTTADDDFDPEQVEDGQGDDIPAVDDSEGEPEGSEEPEEGADPIEEEDAVPSEDEDGEGSADGVITDENEEGFDHEADAAFFAQLDEEEEPEGDEDEEFMRVMASSETDFIGALVAAGEVVRFTPMFSSEDAEYEQALTEAIEAGVFDGDEEPSEDAEFEDGDGDEDDVPAVEPEAEDDIPAVEDDELPAVEPEEDETAGNGDDEEDEVDAELKRILAECDEDDDLALPAPVGEDEEPEAEPEAPTEEPEAPVEEPEDDTTAMFTPVMSLEEIDAALAEDVSMEHFHDVGGASHWNVTIAGKPAACIAHTSVHPNTLEFFNSPDFSRNAIAAMRGEGVMQILSGMQAEFYATAYMRSEMADEVRAAVTADANATMAERLAEMHNGILENAVLASVGFDKNFWKGINPLKYALFDAYEQAGVVEAANVACIEQAFAAAGAQYLEVVLAKAVELLNMPQDARDMIAEKLNESGVLAAAPIAAPEVVEDEAVTASTSFASRLQSGSEFVSASAAPVGGLSASIQRNLGRFVG